MTDLSGDPNVVPSADHALASERHETTQADLRLGDLATVNGRGPLRVTECGVNEQPDFCEDPEDYTVDTDSHPEIPYRETRRKDHTVENPEWETIREPRAAGRRTTLATADGREFAAVDWTEDDAPPQFYMKLVDADDPAGVRWEHLGRVTEVRRHGPEPDYIQQISTAEQGEKYATILSLAADGDLESSVDLPDPVHLRNLANRYVDADGGVKVAVTADEIQDLRACFTAALEHVEATEEWLFEPNEPPNPQRTPLERAIRNRRRSARSKRRRTYIARYPDGDGGHVIKARPVKDYGAYVERYPEGYNDVR